MLERVGLQFLRGLFMGAADIVPGVSGGTIALLLGIYYRLVANVKTGSQALGSLVRLDVSAAKRRLSDVDWLFLVPLLVGILTAVVAMSSVIESLLHDYPEAMAGLFCGLVLASVIVAVGEVRFWTPNVVGLCVVVTVLVFLLLGLQNGPVGDPTVLAWFGAGAVAICAMILPGISGSFLLLMLGMYAPVLNAVNERELGNLAIFALGMVIGLALFSNALAVLLDKARDLTMGALIGLMLGSMRVLWPWPNGVGIISDDEAEAVDGTGLDWPAADEILVPLLLAVAAFAAVVGVSRFADHRANRPASQPS